MNNVNKRKVEVMKDINVPKGSHIVNPLIATEDARKLIAFLEEVFNAKEDKNALAYSETDGKVFNSSVTIGDTSMIIFDRKNGWKHTPSLLQVYVNNIDDKLKKAKYLNAKIVTEPTDFYGGTLARFIDPQGNLWWMFELGEYDESDWGSPDDASSEDDATWLADGDKDMAYVHDSLVEAMKQLDNY